MHKRDLILVFGKGSTLVMDADLTCGMSFECEALAAEVVLLLGQVNALHGN